MLQKRRRRSSGSERIRVPEPFLFPEGQVVDLRVASLAHGGRGVGRRDGFVFLIDGAVPGDLARVRVTRRRPSFAEAEIVEVLRPSPDRVEACCEHATTCGGCPWMSLAASAQRAAKERLVRDSLRRIGGLDGGSIQGVLPAPRPLGYRNRVDLAFGERENRLVLGFHERGRPDRVFGLNLCHLVPPLVSELARCARDLLEAQGQTPYLDNGRDGLLRQLLVRVNRSQSQVLVGVVTTSGAWSGAGSFAGALRERYPQVVGVLRVVSDRRSLAVRGAAELLAGKDHLVETLHGLALEVGITSFLQVNTEGAEKLYETALGLLAPGPGDRLLDLYCGVGAISLLLGRAARSVIGVEADPHAVRLAQRNATRNGVTNLRFERGDVRRALARLLSIGYRAAGAVVNPPRAGMHPAALERLARLAPARIVYISCHPPTLARDAKLLGERGYRMEAVRPVDLFPQTPHVEVVARFERVS